MRRVVLPVLRLLVWTVIAVALCVLAFRGDGSTSAQGDPLQATDDLSQRTITVGTADIASTVQVSGTVAADPAVTVRSTAAGVVSRVYRSVGDAVEAGTPLLDVLVTVEPAQPSTTTAPDGTVTSVPGRARTRTVIVAAGSVGTLATLTVLKDQDVEVGADMATVTPGTLSVSAPLTQSQQFRLLAPPATASVQARGGPAPFTCSGLRTAAAAATGGTPDPFTGQPQELSTAQVSCRVPPGTTVFAGMSVDVTIEAGSAKQVVAVPVSAVLGTVATGTVWVVGADGTPVARPVELGLTDGAQVQVTKGLSAGEQVLEFTLVPSDDDPAAGGSKPGFS